MNSAVFSHVWSPDQGGGVGYIAAFAAALRPYGPVDLYCAPGITAADIQGHYGSNLAGVHLCPFPPLAKQRDWPGLRPARGGRPYDVVLRQSTHVPGPSLCRRAVLITEFPIQARISWREAGYLRTYRRIIANSQFTATWIARRWGRQAVVVPPPVAALTSGTKGPIIVALGRFTGGGRSKGQLEMVHAFRALLAGGVQGWSLHLCGMVEDQPYLAAVRAAALNLPVVLHTDVARRDLEQILGQARLFWHSSGIDALADQPQLLEHFGISTVEAMSAGCVPIVIGRGGQLEVVGADFAAWTWQTWPECIAKTEQLIAAPALWADLAAAARRQADTFSPGNFRVRVASVFADLGMIPNVSGTV